MNGKLAIDPKSYGLVKAALLLLPKGVYFRGLRKALNAWGGVVKDKAASLARRESGLLARSLKVVVRIPDASFDEKHHGKPPFVMVGPRRGLTALVQSRSGAQRTTTLARLKKSGFRGNVVSRRRASRYAHLVERGTKAHDIQIKKGPLAGRTIHHPGSQAQPFIEPAQKLGETVGMERLRAKLQEAIYTEAARLPKAG